MDHSMHHMDMDHGHGHGDMDMGGGQYALHLVTERPLHHLPPVARLRPLHPLRLPGGHRAVDGRLRGRPPGDTAVRSGACAAPECVYGGRNW
ncbi:conserved hypothetical protein [Aspergillus terreus NIH2624]|uniref:Uncharacterized protein n=1 Tax=Aspergillus terreus (strain NIH 2624 / FGSC A1156) TaxID=341663 RepID=Q0CXD2_ASPTN|nr:uncharacterized protein ATEG_01652 [Aspergillus terreus NIH2624]EAU38409.1 conserved hypothetical protein [Aspergillus terreus NIH2624]